MKRGLLTKVFYLMMQSYEACEKKNSSPLAGLLKKEIDDIYLPEYLDAKDAFILSHLKAKFNEIFLFSFTVKKLSPRFPEKLQHYYIVVVLQLF